MNRPELPKPSIRVDAFGDILPTDGRRFVMGDFYTADQLREAVKQERAACAAICEAKAAKVNSRWIPMDCADEIRSRTVPVPAKE